jgi:hypothetical protein
MNTRQLTPRSTPRIDVPRPERTVLVAAAIAAIVMAFATLSVAGPTTEYSLDPVSFDVAPARVEPATATAEPSVTTAALRSEVWHADQSSSGTRPDAMH